jgi:hypothetical protein
VLKRLGVTLVEGEGWRTLLNFFGVEMGMHCGCAQILLFARMVGEVESILWETVVVVD